MRRFVNGIKEHCWDKFLQDWIERRDGKKNNQDCNYGSPLGEYKQKIEFYSLHNLCTIHLRAEEISTGELFEIRILCADTKVTGYPIIALVDFGDYEKVKLFDCDGLCSDGLMKLHYESCYFDTGDYVVTDQHAIGIYANGWYMFICLEKNGKEHLDLYGCGRYVRLATEDEVKQLNEMLMVNNKKWNNETKQLENV